MKRGRPACELSARSRATLYLAGVLGQRRGITLARSADRYLDQLATSRAHTSKLAGLRSAHW